VRAGTENEVYVVVEHERKVFGKITGRAGVTWEQTHAARTQSGD
jgi:hypothetical protein